MRRNLTLGITIALALLVLIVSPTLAQTVSNNGITVYLPDDMVNCDPTFHIMTTGIEETWRVHVIVMDYTEIPFNIYKGRSVELGENRLSL